MYTRLVLVFFFGLLVSKASWAEDSCVSLEDCATKISSIKSALTALKKQMRDFSHEAGIGPIEKDESGKIISFGADVMAGNEFCKDKYGTRLPSLEEYALYAQSLGAKGLIAPENVNIPEGQSYRDFGLSPLYVTMTNGNTLPYSKINFENPRYYYSNQGYVSAEEGLSPERSLVGDLEVRAYFNPETGFLGDDGADFWKLPIRCKLP